MIHPHTKASDRAVPVLETDVDVRTVQGNAKEVAEDCKTPDASDFGCSDDVLNDHGCEPIHNLSQKCQDQQVEHVWKRFEEYAWSDSEEGSASDSPRIELPNGLLVPADRGMEKSRCRILVELLLSDAVQLPLPGEVHDEPARLSEDEVERVFAHHVPHLHMLFYRGKPGCQIVRFLLSCYRDGLSAFKGNPLNEHLRRLFRALVHHGADGGADAARFLTEVAEAFTDCQAVQARVVERTGLELLGVSRDFRGWLLQLLGDYKSLAIQMLAVEHVQQYNLREDQIPTHYGNRLTADLGQLLGLNRADIRRAELDTLAHERFDELEEGQRLQAAQRARELFDLDAVLQALVAELRSFSSMCAADSLPGTFVEWARTHMVQPHLVFDEESCMHVRVDAVFALALLEVVFAGQTLSAEVYRGRTLKELFHCGARPAERALRLPKTSAGTATIADTEVSLEQFFARQRAGGAAEQPKIQKQKPKRAKHDPIYIWLQGARVRVKAWQVAEKGRRRTLRERTAKNFAQM